MGAGLAASLGAAAGKDTVLEELTELIVAEESAAREAAMLAASEEMNADVDANFETDDDNEEDKSAKDYVQVAHSLIILCIDLVPLVIACLCSAGSEM